MMRLWSCDCSISRRHEQAHLSSHAAVVGGEMSRRSVAWMPRIVAAVLCGLALMTPSVARARAIASWIRLSRRADLRRGTSRVVVRLAPGAACRRPPAQLRAWQSSRAHRRLRAERARHDARRHRFDTRDCKRPSGPAMRGRLITCRPGRRRLMPRSAPTTSRVVASASLCSTRASPHGTTTSRRMAAMAAGCRMARSA